MKTESRNNTSYVAEVTEFFKSSGDSNFLRYAQHLMRKYFERYPIRGMLMFWKTGTGKSLLAAAITNWLTRDADAIFVSAKTLHSNFNAAMEKFTKLSGENFHGKVSFVALNASNMFAQIDKATLTPLETFLDARTKKRGSLNGKVIVVDEAHNFFNSITNGSENATKLYQAIMKSDCRLIFLSGSPIVNDPFELALCFNMLAGYKLFPEDYKDFSSYFIGVADGIKTIKNAAKFSNRINGLVSFFDNTARGAVAGDVPEEKPLKVVSVVMSPYQYHEYFQARKTENDALLKKKTGGPVATAPLQKSKSGSASYRVHSRQISNFCYPEYATERTRDENNRVVVSTLFEKLDHADVVKNISLYSPKIAALVENACSLPGLGLIYSQFLKTGLGIISILLQARGVSFGVVSGEIPKDSVDKIISAFNSPENKLGAQMKLILVSATGAEGVDFKNLQHIHILEPYWHSSRLIQVIGRGVRLHSHADLPPEMRSVQPYIYISAHGIEGNHEQTTDEYLYQKSSRNQKLISSFYAVVKAAAIDCQIHYENCRACEPSGKKLFAEDISVDITTSDPSAAARITAKKIEYHGETYYMYEADGEIYFAMLVGGKYIKVDEETRQILLEYVQTLT